MSDTHVDTSTVAAGFGVLSVPGAGLALLFRAAFRIGAEARASERIAADLAEIKVQLRTLADQHTTQGQALLLRLVTLEGRVMALERQSRPNLGE